MGDKGGKKDREKSDRQRGAKQEYRAKLADDRAPKKAVIPVPIKTKRHIGR